MLIFPIPNTFICLKDWSLSSAIDFSVRKCLWRWCIGYTRHYHLPPWPLVLLDTQAIAMSRMWAICFLPHDLRNEITVCLHFRYFVSRFIWRKPSVGCHGWIHNWRNADGFGCACSAACTFPAPKAEKRFWTTDEREIQLQKVHGRGLVPWLCSLAHSAEKWPWLIYSNLSRV